jgi:hypothetical protein
MWKTLSRPESSSIRHKPINPNHLQAKADAPRITPKFAKLNKGGMAQAMPFVFSAATHLNSTCVSESVFETGETQRNAANPLWKEQFAGNMPPGGAGLAFKHGDFAEACVSARTTRRLALKR